MKRRFMEFMNGRYGVDQLSRFMLGVAMVCLILNVFVRQQFVNMLVLVILGVCYFRMFSKNYTQRSAENRKYLEMTQGIRTWAGRQKNLAAQNRDFHIYKCPSCGQKIRIPRGKGKIMVKCPKCGHEFKKKS